MFAVFNESLCFQLFAIPTVFNHSKASEFGASVMSSFESISGTMSSESWGLHGGSSPDTCENVIGNKNKCQGNNTMAERNYPCDAHIVAYFGNHASLDGVGESAFQMQLYHCMMAQSLWMKGEIEKRRSKNSFGMLVSISRRSFFFRLCKRHILSPQHPFWNASSRFGN
jgi:hypothetical protein